MDVAMENYFYDIKFDELIQKAEEDEQEKIKSDLQEIVGKDKWEDVLKVLDEKHIEKAFWREVECIYSELLKQLIKKSYGGNSLVMQNCYAFSESEKSWYLGLWRLWLQYATCNL
ncbi:hypothetical protein [Hespellia stercorisuis]|uniref:Uncharacterized protein n=1 Tax=Hespellia stercorisuis DSM 15480 TaxID=1121950 RepID=A0A1M6J8J6_9FIRM|nr:hypothetical protein [Hespellia stercorisuis]SHJ43033.1 hypothetical protein SAMN02745243_00587 [Hespellia stercorisuis DSM 15480]